MTNTDEPERLVNEALKVLNDAIHLIHYQSTTGRNIKQIAELSSALTDVASVVKHVLSQPTMSGEARNRLDYGTVKAKAIINAAVSEIQAQRQNAAPWRQIAGLLKRKLVPATSAVADPGHP